jgi:hypothetical protein
MTTDRATATAAPDGYGAAARSLSFLPLMMAAFSIVYAVWWPLAWGIPGGIVLALVAVVAVGLIVLSLGQIRHAFGFPSVATAEGSRIGRFMGVLSGVTYGVLWAGLIVLAVLGLWPWIMPWVAVIIGLHFLPMAGLFDRRIDYVLGPLTVLGGLAGGVLAASGTGLWTVYAVAGLGGAVATVSYGISHVVGYRRMARAAGVVAPGPAIRRGTSQLRS